MPVFQYNAIDESNRTRSGFIDSDTARQARQRLRELGLRVTSIDEAKAKRQSSSIFSFFKRSWDSWVAGFTGELATLLSVGVPLLYALETLRQQYSGQSETIVLKLKDSVANGSSLAESMRAQPEIFDSLCTQMVEVGENTGKLDDVLRQVADFKQRSLGFKDRVLSSLLYPAILLSVSVGVSIFLMTVVVPMLLENLEDSGKDLPWPTLVLKSMSDFLLSYGWIFGLFLIAAVGFLVASLRTVAGRRRRDQILLKLPVFGKMSRQQEISRVALVVATLLKSGIKFVPAIEIAKGTSRNELLKDALADCAQQVEAGKDIGIAMQRSVYFPPLVTQVFSVGQESGQLEEMLFRLSSDYDRQVELVSGRLSTVIEPALILILSVFVGFIMFATLLPIMEAGNVY